MSGAVHVVVPRGFDDPARLSGGNTYDRRLCAGLRALGWEVHVAVVEGGWPWTPELGAGELERSLSAIPDGRVVVLDGLLASRLPWVVLPASRRLRVVLLMHLPAGVDDLSARLPEQQVVASATAVVTPSGWCREWLVAEYALDPARVVVAAPGVDRAPAAPGSGGGTSLLCVGAISPVKGQDRLLAALAVLRDLDWTCTCVGADSVDPAFADALRKEVADLGLDGRFVLAGPQTGDDLAAAYSSSDLLVLASRTETYGLAVTEALAHGLPVVATDVGGVRESLGTTRSGPPGLLVAPEGLAGALRRWLTDATLRAGLREAALERRAGLAGWSETARRVGEVVREVAG